MLPANVWEARTFRIFYVAGEVVGHCIRTGEHWRAMRSTEEHWGALESAVKIAFLIILHVRSWTHPGDLPGVHSAGSAPELVCRPQPSCGYCRKFSTWNSRPASESSHVRRVCELSLDLEVAGGESNRRVELHAIPEHSRAFLGHPEKRRARRGWKFIEFSEMHTGEFGRPSELGVYTDWILSTGYYRLEMETWH